MAQTAAKRVSEGRLIPYTPSSTAVIPGQVIVQGGLVGVAHTDIAVDVEGTLAVDGVFDFPKVTGAVTAGAVVYWDANGSPATGDASSGAATTTVSDNTFLGRCTEAAGSSDEYVRVRVTSLVGQTVPGDLTNPIADPGDEGAIPVTASGYCPIVTAGAETRTLAAPTFIGQQLLLYMKTDAGDCVITCATTLNETGDNTITFENTGEAVQFTAVEEGANLRWRCAIDPASLLSTV